MVDAAGAIYVLGGGIGGSGSTVYQDVWVSTNGGALAGLRQGGGRGGYGWVLRAYSEVPQGY